VASTSQCTVFTAIELTINNKQDLKVPRILEKGHNYASENLLPFTSIVVLPTMDGISINVL
jgi:hypothetical protein